MIDITQILLVVVVTVLTVILTLVGIQLINVLKDLRRTLAKMDKVLDDSGVVSGIAAEQATSISGFLNGLTNAMSFLSLLKRRKDE